MVVLFFYYCIIVLLSFFIVVYLSYCYCLKVRATQPLWVLISIYNIQYNNIYVYIIKSMFITSNTPYRIPHIPNLCIYILSINI
jgi:hypothetical protein